MEDVCRGGVKHLFEPLIEVLPVPPYGDLEFTSGFKCYGCGDTRWARNALTRKGQQTLKTIEEHGKEKW